MSLGTIQLAGSEMMDWETLNQASFTWIVIRSGFDLGRPIGNSVPVGPEASQPPTAECQVIAATVTLGLWHNRQVPSPTRFCPPPGGASDASPCPSPQPPVLLAVPQDSESSEGNFSLSVPAMTLDHFPTQVTASLCLPQPPPHIHSIIQVPGHPQPSAAPTTHTHPSPSFPTRPPPHVSLSNGPCHRSLPHARSPVFLPRREKEVTQFLLAHLRKGE